MVALFASPEMCGASAGLTCAGVSVWSGKVIVNVEPSPGWLVTEISPPSSWQKRWEIAKPRPVPPYFLLVEASAWLNAWNSRPSCSSVMPIPVSEIANRTIGRSVSKRSATKVSRPFSVNLLPLLRILSRLCLSLVRSVRMLPRFSVSPNSRTLPLVSASGTMIARTSSSSGTISTSSRKMSIRPASTFDRSRMSLIRPSK